MSLIYLLEDDDSIRELIIYTLNTVGYTTTGFSLPSELRKAMEQKQPDLLLLDIMLPEQDGLTILKKIRNTSKTSRLPIIMLTAKGTEYDRVIGLDSGADDYISKPFGMMELIARIKALLRRTEPETSGCEYRIGDLIVNTDHRTCRVKDRSVDLSLKEFELLCVLMRSPGTVLTRDRLHNEVWDYDFDGESRTVDVHIRFLRQKLGEAGEYIQTVRGIGYKLEDKS